MLSKVSERGRPQTVVLHRRSVLVGLLLMACALCLYLWRLDQPRVYVYDEVYHAYTAGQLVRGNPDAVMWNTQVPQQDRGVAYEWTHPPFAKYMMESAILVLGDNAWGWRFASAVFGAISIGTLYALGLVLFDHTVGLFAAVLMLLDGLWFVQSRTAMNDVFMVTFLLLAYLAFALYLRDPHRRHLLWLVGIALGLSIASKWSALYSWLWLSILTVVHELRHTQAAKDMRLTFPFWRLVGVFVALPLMIYVTSYSQFFALGHTVPEWLELQRQMWSYHTNLKATHVWQSPAWSWPFMVTPVWYYTEYQKNNVANIFAMGNPLIWWMFLPAIAFVFNRWRTTKYQAIGLGIVLLGFYGQWLPWFFSPRITFLYHMLPSVPFGCLAIAYVLRQFRGRYAVGAYVSAVVIAFMFFYSQYAALLVSSSYAAQHYWFPTWSPR